MFLQSHLVPPLAMICLGLLVILLLPTDKSTSKYGNYLIYSAVLWPVKYSGQ